jgi:hypothetical protein
VVQKFQQKKVLSATVTLYSKCDRTLTFEEIKLVFCVPGFREGIAAAARGRPRDPSRKVPPLHSLVCKKIEKF